MTPTDKTMALADEYANLLSSPTGSFSGKAREALRIKIEELARDAERLDWMIFHSAKVRHSSDGEFCTVIWYDDEGQTRETKPFSNARDAIDAAMQEKQK